MDVFSTFIELLRQTGNVTKSQTDFDQSSPKYLLKQEVPKIIRSVNRQLREKSVKTKVGAFSVLKEVVIVLPDCLADHIGSLTPGIEKALCDKSSSSNLKIEALVFTRLALASHAPSVFHSYIKKELIRTVDLGPFKHTVDDGLELRKAAFECVDTLLDSCLDQMNPSSFIVPYLSSGLDDHYDVKMPCHLILSKLAEKCPAVLAVLDSLVDPLQKTINFRPKQDAVKQEVDRNEDMIRSAPRVIASLNRISGDDCSHKFKYLMNEIAKSPNLWEKYCSIRNE